MSEIMQYRWGTASSMLLSVLVLFDVVLGPWGPLLLYWVNKLVILLSLLITTPISPIQRELIISGLY